MFVMQVNQYQLGVFVFAEASVRMNEQAIFLFMTPFKVSHLYLGHLLLL